MTSFENFHHQFRGLVERAMLSEIEDMLRIISEALDRVDRRAALEAERAAERLHSARRRGAEDPRLHTLDEELRLGQLFGAPRNRIDAPPRSNVDIGGALPS